MDGWGWAEEEHEERGDILPWKGDDIRSARNKTKQHILQFFFTFYISQTLFPVFFAVSSNGNVLLDFIFR